MELIKRLATEEEGQGMSEYALILGLVVLGIWVAVKSSGLGAAITTVFGNVKAVLSGCTSGACGN